MSIYVDAMIEQSSLHAQEHQVQLHHHHHVPDSAFFVPQPAPGKDMVGKHRRSHLFPYLFG